MQTEFSLHAIALALDENAKKNGPGYKIRCPNPHHDDKTPSCYLDEKQGKLLWHCFGCQDDVAVRQAIEATGLYKYKPDSLHSFLHGSWLDRLVQSSQEIAPEENPYQGWIRPMNDLRAMDFPPEITLCGPLNMGKVVHFVAPTGAGKTFFAHGIAESVSQGTHMGHWGAPEARKALVIDGELTGTDLVRIADVMGVKGEYDVLANFLIAEGGQINMCEPAWADFVVERASDYDLVVFDNVYSLFPSSDRLKSVSAEYGRVINTVLNRLKQLNTTSVLFDHPGKSGQTYGTATKAWGADLIGIMTREACEGFEQGQAGFWLSFKGEDGGKIRGEYVPALHSSTKWLLDDKWVAY